MPRIHPVFLGCVIFLYPDRKSAEEGADFGGTGFLANVDWKSFPRSGHIYAVTNSHIIQDGFSVIRVNRKDGGIEIWEYDEVDWEPDPSGSDLSVLRVEPTDEHAWSCIPVHLPKGKEELCFLTDDIILDYSIGIGDEVFSPGRLIDVSGKQRNRPVVQFGCISMMPPEKILGQESLLVELRSRTGFSGSPIFVFLPPTAEHMRPKTRKEMHSDRMYGPWLLGMRWGQFPTRDQLGDKEGQEELAKYASGMVMAIPAQRIAQFLLSNEKLARQRQDIEDLARRQGINDVLLESTTARQEPSTKADNPSHKEDFSRLLSSVATGKPRDDQT